jgi:hypothetical protein
MYEWPSYKVTDIHLEYHKCHRPFSNSNDYINFFILISGTSSYSCRLCRFDQILNSNLHPPPMVFVTQVMIWTVTKIFSKPSAIMLAFSNAYVRRLRCILSHKGFPSRLGSLRCDLTASYLYFPRATRLTILVIQLTSVSHDGSRASCHNVINLCLCHNKGCRPDISLFRSETVTSLVNSLFAEVTEAVKVALRFIGFFPRLNVFSVKLIQR